MDELDYIIYGITIAIVSLWGYEINNGTLSWLDILVFYFMSIPALICICYKILKKDKKEVNRK